MRTLVYLLMIAVGVSAILYCRVNLGMSWDEMALSLEEGFIPRLRFIAVYVLSLVTAVACVKYLNRSR